MLLSDLLPALFDLVVLHSTGRALLSIEREGVLDALVNCVAESVMRQVRASDGDTQVGSIITDDHFSDKWISRTEIVDMLGQSSGLPRELSEFALVLIESRLDVRIDENGANISEIGAFNLVISPSQTAPNLADFTRSWWLADEALFRSQLTLREETLAPFWLFRGWRRGSTSRLLERALLYSSFRRAVPYNITLSKGLAYPRQHLSFSKVEITGSTRESGLR
ncbi:hypothetical protein H8B02_44380 [Bradyrhizobium sp. Pear77]|uniref:hypothetical protein n=1 Tax=Bradyrhizobium altum TaxID=1571202 RepID=UPI001E3AA8E1|nr:hypothetical protein [Bradyrhizobium altum]MCC8960197.1 hypothetical protein [Bradyrhizobium altum]